MAQIGRYRTPLSGIPAEAGGEPLAFKSPLSFSAAASKPLRERPEAGRPSVQERIAYGALLLFVSLIYISPGMLYHPLEDWPIAKGLAVISFLFLFSAMRAKGTPWRLTDPPSLFLIAFAVCNGLSIITALWREYALNAFLDFLKVVLVYFLILHLLNRNERIRPLFWVITWAAMVPAVGALVRFFLKIDLVEGYRAAWIGIYADPNDLAYNLVILIPVVLALLEMEQSFFKRLLLLVPLCIFLVTIYLTFSRGGLVGLMVVFFFQFLRSRNRLFNFALAAALGAVLLPLAPARYWERAETILNFRQDESAMGRVYAWKAGFAMVQDRPLLGVGVGCFVLGWPIYAPGDAGTKWRAAHNTFVNVMGETGLPGLVSFLGLMGSALWRIRRPSRSAPRVRRPLMGPMIGPTSAVGRPPRLEAIQEDETDRRAALYARAAEIALWGFLACSLTLGVSRTWPPYIFAGLAVVLQRKKVERE
ncbi:MAG: O-antigen ligase family protein [Nitrospirae bacterium]|nr:O-antigen ligase family protein [Candidatus Manganitrophaceae bacterium]